MAISRICSVPGCGKRVLAKGWCSTHYSRVYTGLPLIAVPRPTTCSIEGCGKPVSAHGWCRMHAQRAARNGDPLVTLRAPQHEPWEYIENTAIPYQADGCLIWPYGRDADGRAIAARPGANAGNVHVSRFICSIIHGEPPTPEHQAAHSCGKGHLGCLSPAHLRWATPKENNADKIEHGTNGHKLIAEQVIAIRRLKGSMRAPDIGKAFGITEGTVRGIQNGSYWKNLPD